MLQASKTQITIEFHRKGTTDRPVLLARENAGPPAAETREREQSSVNAAYDDDSSVSRCIFLTDKRMKTSFLADTGADVCVYPRSKLHGPSRKDDYELFAINATPIAT
jgi:hypothetical protein